MSQKKLSRRQMLRGLGLVAVGAAAAACQPKTVVVKETVKETVIVEGTPKVVEKEKVVWSDHRNTGLSSIRIIAKGGRTAADNDTQAVIGLGCLAQPDFQNALKNKILTGGGVVNRCRCDNQETGDRDN